MENVITQLDKSSLTYLRSRIETILEPLAKELGVTIDIGTCTFNANNCRFQLKIAVLDSNGEPITEEAESFKHNAKTFGFEPTDLGREFFLQGKTFIICGLKPKSWKYPIIARSGNGQSYKFTCRTVLNALASGNQNSNT